MRITFVLATLELSGGNRVISIYTAELAKRGHQVTIVLALPGRGRLGRLLDLLPGRAKDLPQTHEAHLDYGPVEVIHVEGRSPAALRRIPDADVVIATWWETAEVVAMLPRAKGRHCYLVQHHEVFDYLPRDRVERTYRLPMLQVVVSRWLETIMRERYGSTELVCVPNAVDASLFSAPPRSRRPVPTVGFVYPGTTAWKGGDVMIEACVLARREVPELQVVLFGKDPAEVPLPPGFDLIVRPPQQEIPGLYASCDAWLFGSRSEGFGLPVLEAMACRTPVIGTPAGAAPELIGSDAGRLVPFDDPAAMAHAIVEFARMPEGQWQALSDAAFARATSYGWSDAVTRLEQALASG